MRNCEDTCRDPDIRLEKWFEGFFLVQNHLLLVLYCIWHIGMHATAYVWRSKNDFVELVLSIHLYMGYKN